MGTAPTAAGWLEQPASWIIGRTVMCSTSAQVTSPIMAFASAAASG